MNPLYGRGLLPFAMLVLAWSTIAEFRSDWSMQGRFLWSTNVKVPMAIQIRQNQAKLALEEMKEEDVFATEFSTREMVFQRGFLRHWDPCVLQKRFQQKQQHSKEPLQIVITGGSPSSRPGDNCTTDGKYSALLEERLRKHSGGTAENTTMAFEVVNMAQGGTTSVLGALLLDQYIDINKTDVIVWEFLINDNAGRGGKEEQVRKLDHWLTRVHALFAQAGKSPPPIVINYLWGYNCGFRLSQGMQNNVDYNPLQYGGALIDSYRALGWDIAVLNIGAAVNSTVLRSQPRLLFDDGSHPSCAGTHFIANMLAHLFYTNLAEDCTDLGSLGDDDNKQSIQMMVPEHKQLAPNNTHDFDRIWENSV